MPNDFRLDALFCAACSPYRSGTLRGGTGVHTSAGKRVELTHGSRHRDETDRPDSSRMFCYVLRYSGTFFQGSVNPNNGTLDACGGGTDRQVTTERRTGSIQERGRERARGGGSVLLRVRIRHLFLFYVYLFNIYNAI